MWTKKHKELKTQAGQKVKMTAAELNAVRIIENWLIKKQRQSSNSNKAEIKKTAPGETDRFKEA